MAVYYGNDTARLHLLCGRNTETLVMTARTSRLLVKMSNHCIHFVKYLFHVTFIIVRLVLLFLVRKLPASHPLPNTLMVPPLILSRKIPRYVECPLACPFQLSLIKNRVFWDVRPIRGVVEK